MWFFKDFQNCNVFIILIWVCCFLHVFFWSVIFSKTHWNWIELYIGMFFFLSWINTLNNLWWTTSSFVWFYGFLHEFLKCECSKITGIAFHFACITICNVFITPSMNLLFPSWFFEMRIFKACWNWTWFFCRYYIEMSFFLPGTDTLIICNESI